MQIETLVFCGTPRFAVPTLEELVAAGYRVALVVTQPDKPKGRGMEMTTSPVKQSASALGIPLLQPATIKNNAEFRQILTALAPQAIVVVGYGRIIPQWMIELPPLGNINLHASLLPKYRGAAPVQWAIARGEIVTGNTTMRIDAGLDTGNILLQQELPIAAQDTSETLAPRLAAMGAELMVETVRGLADGSLVARSQNSAQATLAPILRKEDGLVGFHRPAQEIYNRWRGFTPWPGSYTTFRGKGLGLSSLQMSASIPDGPLLGEGELRVAGNSLLAGCGEGTIIEVLELQPEGKKRTSVRDFINGYRIQPGEKFGAPSGSTAFPNSRL